ncbi:MAG: hypothetical protein M3N98_15125, partial [Actinomycetota bacterium]|nr:hypothetical protein [Actinomycetota bacterium]
PGGNGDGGRRRRRRQERDDHDQGRARHCQQPAPTGGPWYCLTADPGRSHPLSPLGGWIHRPIVRICQVWTDFRPTSAGIAAVNGAGVDARSTVVELVLKRLVPTSRRRLDG